MMAKLFYFHKESLEVLFSTAFSDRGAILTFVLIYRHYLIRRSLVIHSRTTAIQELRDDTLSFFCPICARLQIFFTRDTEKHVKEIDHL